MIENNKCKNLVIYGSNLGSTVNFIYYNRFIPLLWLKQALQLLPEAKKRGRQERNIINIPINLNSIILGIILSDGHIFKNKANNTLLSFSCLCKATLCCGPLMWATTAGPQESKGKQTIDRFDFFLSVFNKFSHFCFRPKA
jgi:hypothetical protein